MNILSHYHLQSNTHLNVIVLFQPSTTPMPQATPYEEDELLKEEDWEEQAGLLYEWTPQLTLDELELKSP